MTTIQIELPDSLENQLRSAGFLVSNANVSRFTPKFIQFLEKHLNNNASTNLPNTVSEGFSTECVQPTQ